VSGLNAWYGQAQALFEVGLGVDSREIVGVIGRNGAGKSTLLRSIAGAHAQRAGIVRFGGRELSALSAHQITALGISLVREGGRVFTSLTVDQNLRLGQQTARIRRRAPRSLDEIWEWFPVLASIRSRQAGLLSGGQRQALALAIAFVSDPDLLLLDEPSAGLAPSVAFQIFETVRALTKEGMAILVAEQNLAWLIGLAARVYGLETGRVGEEGPPQSFVTTESRVRWRQ
jgi:branched-chain amino acid transport system ATP-binding protein